jgi:hypothetical protein
LRSRRNRRLVVSFHRLAQHEQPEPDVARLTVSLPTAPPNSAFKARRTRRVLVPAK